MAVTIATTLILALAWRLRGRRVALALVTTLAATTLAWTTTTEIYAAHGESLFARSFYDTLPKPANWLDRATGTRPVVFLGLAVARRQPDSPARVLEQVGEGCLVARRVGTGTGGDRDA